LFPKQPCYCWGQYCWFFLCGPHPHTTPNAYHPPKQHPPPHQPPPPLGLFGPPSGGFFAPTGRCCGISLGVKEWGCFLVFHPDVFGGVCFWDPLFPFILGGVVGLKKTKFLFCVHHVGTGGLGPIFLFFPGFFFFFFYFLFFFFFFFQIFFRVLLWLLFLVMVFFFFGICACFFPFSFYPPKFPFGFRWGPGQKTNHPLGGGGFPPAHPFLLVPQPTPPTRHQFFFCRNQKTLVGMFPPPPTIVDPQGFFFFFFPLFPYGTRLKLFFFFFFFSFPKPPIGVYIYSLYCGPINSYWVGAAPLRVCGAAKIFPSSLFFKCWFGGGIFPHLLFFSTFFFSLEPFFNPQPTPFGGFGWAFGGGAKKQKTFFFPGFPPGSPPLPGLCVGSFFPLSTARGVNNFRVFLPPPRPPRCWGWLMGGLGGGWGLWFDTAPKTKKNLSFFFPAPTLLFPIWGF